ncbi:MAG: PAS domain S-box protein [Nitrospira defluvii]|nr:PAS domain S-box protein [Nitrospira defluvii]
MTVSPPSWSILSWSILLRRALPGAASVTALVAGCLALISRVFDLGSMHKVESGLSTMTPLTSIAVILAGASLWLVQAEQTRRQQWRLATVCSLGAIMMGVVMLVEYAVGWDVGHDHLPGEEAAQALGPGWIAPVMAFGLLIVGSALFIWEGPLGVWLTRGMGLLAALLSVVPIVVSLFEFFSEGRSFSGAGPSAIMALHATLTLMVLSVGVLSLRRHGPAPASRRIRPVPALRPSRLVGMALALSVAAVAAVGYLSYLQAEKILRAEYSIRLGSLADERQRALALILREQLMTLKQIAQGLPIQDAARRLRSAEQVSPRVTLSEAQSSTAFHGLLLAAAPGSTRHAASGSFEGTSLGLWAADVAAASNEPLVRLERGDDGKLVLLLGLPVEDPAMPSRPLGVLLASASTMSITELFASRAGLGATGESFLADRLGRPMTAIRYSRPGHGEGSAHKIEGDPMRRCLQGERSSFAVMPAYENVLTVMAYRNVPEIGGGCLMVHIRAGEVFASTGQLQVKRLSLMGLALFVVVGGMLFIGTRMFRDIVRERLRQNLALRLEMERPQRLQLSVSHLLMEQGTVEETIPKLLATIGEGMGWHLGQCWMLQSAPNVLRCEAVWPAPSVLVDESTWCNRMIASSSGVSFSGPPLGGESRLPTWDQDLDKDRPRASDSAAAPAGMRCRLRIPALVGGEVLALLEFFSRDPRPQEVTLLRVVRDLGIKVGQFLARKRAESEQTRLLTVLNASLNEIYMFRTDTLRFTYVNRSALDNLGYTLEAMQALTPIDIKPEVTEVSFRELVNPLLTGEQAQLIFQTVHQRKNGRTYSVEVHLQVVGQGEERTFLALIHDVTARKQQEHRQATEHAVTQLLLEANTLEEAVPGILERICRTLDWNVGVLWRVDEEMQVLRCAEVWGEQHADCAQFIERTRQSNFAMGIGLPGRVWKSRRVEWITDVTRDDNFPRTPYAVDAGLHAAFAFPIGSCDRLHGIMEFYATALREPDQKLLDMVEGLAGQIAQFLERKLAEQRLHNAKSQAEKAAREKAEILATVEAFFIGVTDQGIVSEWTNRAEYIFGIPLRDAIGRSLRDLPIAWSWDEILAALRKAGDTLTTVRLEKIRLTVPGAKEKFVKLTVSPLCDDRGVGYVLMGEDMTDRLVLEHELVQAQKLESIGHLAAGIAHEINTPTQFVGDNVRFLSDSFSDIGGLLEQYQRLLTAAKTGACPQDLIETCEAANRGADLEYLLAEIPKALEQSAEGIDRVATIVRAMKEFAHPGSTEKVAVNINKAIESTVTVARNEWKYVADLHTNLDPSLPPVPCLVGEFNQVVLNMIVNATHAIADVVKNSGQKGAISIASCRVGDWVEIRITDTGTGIPDHIQCKIFDPFFTTKEVGKGTGQGLAIARSVVVDKHHGTIAVESQVGKGTTFIIRLPLTAQGESGALKEAA